MTDTAPTPHYNPVRLTPEEQQAFERLADLLGETQAQPLTLLSRIIRFCDLDFCERILEETFAIEQRGGMKRKDGKGYRTTGGIFFYLAKQHAPREARIRAFRQASSNDPTTKPPPRFSWKKRRKIVSPLLESPGEVEHVRVTLIGYPDTVQEQDGFVTLTIVHHAAIPTIPKGVPRHINATTGPHVVYVAAEQWQKVADSLSDESTKFTIQGLCASDAETGQTVVYATSISSKAPKKRRKPQQGSAPPHPTQP